MKYNITEQEQENLIEMKAKALKHFRDMYKKDKNFKYGNSLKTYMFVLILKNKKTTKAVISPVKYKNDEMILSNHEQFKYELKTFKYYIESTGFNKTFEYDFGVETENLKLILKDHFNKFDY